MIYSSVDGMKGEVELQVEDLHARVVTETDFNDFGTIENTDTLTVNEREMWLHSDQENLQAMNDASIFYAEFPSLPDFPFILSSSSSSPTPAPAKTTTCSYSSTTASSSCAASWAVLKSDVEKDLEKRNSHHYINQCDPMDASPLALFSTASLEIPQPIDPSHHCVGVGDNMNPTETFWYMDLSENNDLFDPSLIFQNDENPSEEFTQEKEIQLAPIVHHQPPPQQQEVERGEYEAEGEGDLDGEMRIVFLEWLKSNKDSVSANELRSVKLHKSTIEFAVRHLGGGKQAIKKLLKLILQWVQTSHLQNNKRKENTPSDVLTQFKNPSQNQFFHDPGDRLMRLGPLATKEARKKRMARKKRYLSHHNHHGQQQNQNGVTAQVNPANCVHWQGSMASVMPAELPAKKIVMDRMAVQNQNYHRGRVSLARRQVAGP